MKYILFLLIFTSIAFAQEEDCFEGVLGQEKELLTLIQTMKNDVIGGTPYFCRPDKKQLNDTEVDEVLNKYLREVIDKVPKGKKPGRNPKVLFRVMQSTAVKSLWQVSSKDLKYQMLLRKSCFELPLNKLPIESSEKDQVTSNEAQSQQDEKILKRLDQICGAKNWSELVPYLSKDLVTEGMYYVSEMDPSNLAQNMDEMCKAYEDVVHISAEEVSDMAFYQKKDPKLILSFSEWLKQLRPQISFDHALFDSFQDQGRIISLKKLLSKDEAKALFDYTQDAYKNINSCLRKDSCSSLEKKKIKNLNGALKKIKAANAKTKFITTFRGANGIPDTLLQTLEEAAANGSDGVVVDSGFMSSSGKWSTARTFSEIGTKGKNFIYIINSKSCVGVSKMSHAEDEDEFLCPSGMKFKVTKPATLNNTYVLEEVEK